MWVLVRLSPLEHDQMPPRKPEICRKCVHRMWPGGANENVADVRKTHTQVVDVTFGALGDLKPRAR